MNAQHVLTADGASLAATFHGEAQGQIRGAVLIVPAMATAQRYYTPFAAWLAAQGYLVATFDYRGTGLSRPERLRGFPGDLLTWATLDCGAMLEALAARAAGRPLYWIGHSLGGQILPLAPTGGRLARAVLIASGSGYWRHNPPALRRRVLWLWWVAAPIALPLWGYFPGRTLRIIGDLPKGVMAQWRRWCLDPDYLLGEGAWVRDQFAAFTTPLTSISFPDDEYMSAASTQSLERWYVSAPVTVKRIAPEDIGAQRIGHFGFFRGAFERSLWEPVLLPELR